MQVVEMSCLRELSRLRARQGSLVEEAAVVLKRVQQGGPRADVVRYRTLVAEIGEVELEVAVLTAD